MIRQVSFTVCCSPLWGSPWI